MSIRCVLPAALVASVLAPLSIAAPVDDALAALNRGEVGAAVGLLKDRRDAPSLTVLARAYVAQSASVTTPADRAKADRAKLYAASEAAARAAIAADRRYAGGYVELANALALQLQGAGPVQATRTGLELRRLFEQAVALDPAQARAWMGLGVWHAQALGLGPLVVLATGASEQKMRAAHQRAIDLAPNEVFFRLSYADSLLLLAQRDGARRAALTQEARALLTGALALTPQNYWQKYDQAQAQRRLAGSK